MPLTRILVVLALLPRLAGAQSLVQQIPPEYRQYAASYDVRLSYVGYVGLVEGAPKCDVNTQGTDVLTGTLTGVEMPDVRDEDVMYTGVLKRSTTIDFCETKPGRAADEPVFCVVKLHGVARMEVELTIYGEADRGAWVKAQAVTAADTVIVGGDCAPQTLQEVRTAYPSASDGGGASPSGQDIDSEGKTRTGIPVSLFSGNLARLRPGIYRYPSSNPSQGWTLEVIRRLP